MPDYGAVSQHSEDPTRSSSHVSAIVGGVLGGIIGTVSLILAMRWSRRTFHWRNGRLHRNVARGTIEAVPYTYARGNDLPALSGVITEKKQREILQERADHEARTAASGIPNDAVPAGVSNQSDRDLVEDVEGLRGELAELRRLVHATTPGALEAPPSYVTDN